MADHFHIVTGGPGSGKTSLIEALARSGFRHMREAGERLSGLKLPLAEMPCRGATGPRSRS
jgi:predicted ATPase